MLILAIHLKNIGRRAIRVCSGAAVAGVLLLAQPRPDAVALLNHKCLGCHSGKNSSSGLSIENRDGVMTGGARGPAIIPGKPEESLMVAALRQTGSLKMPPDGKLPEAEIQVIEKWIAGGAPGLAEPAKKAGATHWSLIAPKRPPEPAVKQAAWTRNAIDRFILARLEKEKLRPSPEADQITLLRRVSLDLTGITPSPKEVDEFLADTRPDAYERQVDRLLASPHYGERWGRHWLDQARYADSDSGSRDEPRQIYKYREWVIHSLNRDQPFDQFVIEQLAGDLLPKATPEQITATGFQRNSLLQIEAGTDREQYRVEAVMDRVDTFGTVLLGLSLGCARCHDHKFDPIRQREYYQIFSFFNNIEEFGPDLPAFGETNDLDVAHAPVMALGKPEDVARWQALRDQLLALYIERMQYKERLGSKKEKDDPGLKHRTETIEALKKQLPKDIERTLVMRERPQPREAYVLLGGDYQARGARVVPGVLGALQPLPADAARPGHRLNRLDLAKWVTDPANPLFARVAVNRIWQQYFGRGLVETENDFGKQGAKPSHPELLDWLATEFVRSGFSQKAIHRLIATSAVYRQSSKTRADIEKADPRNLLLARQSRLRLDAEIIRDAALVSSGLLNDRVGGPSVFPPQPDGAMAASQVKKSWVASKGADRYRRGMYTHFWRVTPHPALVVFDQPNAMVACTRRARTDTPLQALTLLNDSAFFELAQGMAKRILESGPSGASGRIDYAMRITVCRTPDQVEKEQLARLLAAELDEYKTHPEKAQKLGGGDQAAWTALSRVLLNTDEFITRE
ncbi:MAG TPA: PSD1 and planctomycete cytochrome C domain-containing protein [Bryobacteraceae bacterium]|nr:PSD1 and planctomycete cytochrome C domain-containing protein [Bryobacteraceae bacterium]